MIFSKTKTILRQTGIILGALETIFLVWKTKFLSTKKINTVASKIIGTVKKVVSAAGLIFDSAEKTGSKSSKIADKREMILNREFSNLFGKKKSHEGCRTRSA